jgi:hypothetical protein
MFGTLDTSHAMLTEVSLRYKESFLRGGGVRSDGQRMNDTVEFYYEIRPTRVSGSEPMRFSLEAATEEREQVSWIIILASRSPSRPEASQSEKNRARF